MLVFMYDESGDIFGFTYNGAQYYYLKNAQNDVWAVTNADGQAVVLYFYDAWGDVAKRYVADGYDTIAQINPILYRSYYCDLELGFYYLNTRYYAPTIHRFLNADSLDILEEDQGSVIENNIFAYCLNNPVGMADQNGEIAVSAIIGGIAGGVTGAALGYLLAKKLGYTGWKRAALIAAATVGGAALGAFLGPHIAKLGGKVAARVGIKSAARQTIKMSSNKLWRSSAKHIFSKKHIKDGIMRLGGSQRSIYNKLYRVVKANLGNAVNGSNQIHTTINGVKTTIRFYVSNGQVQNIDAFTGWATRVIGKLL